MIFIKRPEAPSELDLSDIQSRAARERASWLEYIEGLKQGKKKKRPNFSAYSSDSVRILLDKIFHSKCSYCERDVIGAGEIEHYRPKNAVQQEDGMDFEVEFPGGDRVKVGYWWLGMAWNNLLYACPQCNQIRRRVSGEGVLISAGKGKKFPIKNEQARAREPGEELGEEPLLLDPCVDHPEGYLEFVLDSSKEEWGMVMGRMLEDGTRDPRGHRTVQLFFLNHREHVRRRRRTLKRIARRQQDVLMAIREVDRLADGEERQQAVQDLKEKLAELKEYLDPDEEDLLMARQAILPFLQALRVNNPLEEPG